MSKPIREVERALKNASVALLVMLTDRQRLEPDLKFLADIDPDNRYEVADGPGEAGIVRLHIVSPGEALLSSQSSTGVGLYVRLRWAPGAPPERRYARDRARGAATAQHVWSASWSDAAAAARAGA